MTPEAIRRISQIRQEFYHLFAGAMKVPVSITNRNSYAGNASIVSWTDRRQRLNYICVYAHTAPDDLIPERPFILRLSINKGGDTSAILRQGRSYQSLNQGQHFELTILPSEILDFLPWVVSLVRSYEESYLSLPLAPPHPFNFSVVDVPQFDSVWTQAARSNFAQSLLASRADLSQLPARLI
jgi:hypothetical protein